ncbi:TetR/AcrR family transcriptional regulator [Quadrisphaera sp. DSM 44207]|uniref:TetR/AcrR family transcriptional regulator n=1 Tax=Quadrisphaera sp. DSM 44207 TaxID=1881057 RepID=UPI00088FAF6C|nr:TetR/AcrR family transcriptional regulator [Quadrisphaera sp. DSM 44207]SDQ04090.1 transcriptional regulator, TetR family [Quadrisphaera sp. DSM 44207]
MRADAARNREAVLAAAGRLFDAAADPDQVSMDDVAAAAGVGKGTLFRRFGSRTGLVLALFEQRTSQLYDTLTAVDDRRAPAEQAMDLLTALLRFKNENQVVALAIDATDGNPYHNADYDRWHALLTRIVTGVRGPRSADFLAHALLAVIRSDFVAHLGDWPERRLHDGLAALVHAVLGDGEASTAPALEQPSPSASS